MVKITIYEEVELTPRTGRRDYMVYQLTPTLLDAMVLAVIEREDAYGYMIAQRLKIIANQKESTLYPVLKRLQQAEFLVTYDQAYQGRNRRYYKITEKGINQLNFYRREWTLFKSAADEIMGGGEKDEQK